MSAQRRKQKDRRKKAAKALRRAAKGEAEAKDVDMAKAEEDVSTAMASLSMSIGPHRVKLEARHGSVKPDAFERDRVYLSRRDMVRILMW